MFFRDLDINKPWCWTAINGFSVMFVYENGDFFDIEYVNKVDKKLKCFKESASKQSCFSSIVQADEITEKDMRDIFSILMRDE